MWRQDLALGSPLWPRCHPHLSSTVKHFEVCPIPGRISAPYNAIRDILAQMVRYCGLTDAAKVESPVQAAARRWHVVYVDRASIQRVIFEVAIVTDF